MGKNQEINFRANSKKMNASLLCALTFTLAFRVCNGELPAAADYTPPPGSPLAKGEHPRIFVTSSKLPQLKTKILNYYQSDLQNFITHLDEMLHIPPGTGDLEEWNDIIGAARSYAFLYLIDPMSIPGIASQYSRQKYGKKAIDLALFLAENLPDRWTETHHGAKNLATDKGGLASLALQVVYDWTHDLSTEEDRRRIADRLMSLWNNRYDSKKVKLENHYATNVHVYAGALCFYGDTDLGPIYTTKANEMMRSFHDVFLRRQLGVAEKLFEGSSDWIEGDSYSQDSYTGIMLLAAAAGSAMGERYFETNPWLRYAPLFLYYNIMPMPYKGEYFFSQQNTSSVIDVRDQFTSAIMNMSASMLENVDPQLSGFAAWFTQKSPYGLQVENYKYNDPHLFDLFYKFLMGSSHIAPKSPEASNIPLSARLGQMHAMRSDHSLEDATLIQFFCPKFWYENGHNEQEQGAFNIHRFGTLAISAANSKNAGKELPRVDKNGKGFVQNNIFGLGGSDFELAPDMEDAKGMADTPDRFYNGAPEHIGTVEAREYLQGLYDYINYNYTNSYKGGSRASLARRALVYLRGPVNHEYVVVMDRVNSPHEKYFVIHTPTEPIALEKQWLPKLQGHWTSTGRTISVVNRIDRAHGQMYLTSVFPEKIEMHKFGGPGHEWVWADGMPLDYDPQRFSEKAAYLLSSYTLQIRSQNNQFLTVMQVGDANTIGKKASVQALSGKDWIGVLLGQERVVVFSKSENLLSNISYQVSSLKPVQHLLTELVPQKPFSVLKSGNIVATGSTGPNGTISFKDTPGRTATYMIQVGK